MSPKRTGMHFLFCFVDLALIAPNIRWIRRFSAAAQHLIMVHFNLSPLAFGAGTAFKGVAQYAVAVPLVTAVGAGNVPFLGAVADMFNTVAVCPIYLCR